MLHRSTIDRRGKPVVAAGKTGPRVVHVVSARFRSSTTGDQVAITEREERLASPLDCGLKVIIDEHPRVEAIFHIGGGNGVAYLGRSDATVRVRPPHDDNQREILDHHVGAVCEQRFAPPLAIHANNKTKSARVSGLHSGRRVLDHYCARRQHAQLPRGLQKGVR